MIFRLEGVEKWFGEPPTKILKGISLEIGSGQLVSISGRSGSGKSTLLYIISSLDSPSAGRVLVDQNDLHKLNMEELHRFRNQHMGFVFQFHYLLPELSALENVLMPARKLERWKDREKRAIELLEEFGMGDKLHRFPTQLSGGEQQRVSIARALIMEPKILFADEPTGNLDTTNGRIVMDYFLKIHQNYGTSIVYVTHDPSFAQLAQRRLFMVDGQVEKDEWASATQ
jgi:lipoprotein-releasing system ATP-binding protein